MSHHHHCFNIFLCLLFDSAISFLHKNELSIAIGISQELKVDHCIFVGNEGNFNDIKKFSYDKISTAFFKYNTFTDYYNNLTDIYVYNCIIVKAINLNAVLSKFEGVSILNNNSKLIC